MNDQEHFGEVRAALSALNLERAEAHARAIEHPDLAREAARRVDTARAEIAATWTFALDAEDFHTEYGEHCLLIIEHGDRTVRACRVRGAYVPSIVSEGRARMIAVPERVVGDAVRALLGERPDILTRHSASVERGDMDGARLLEDEFATLVDRLPRMASADDLIDAMLFEQPLALWVTEILGHSSREGALGVVDHHAARLKARGVSTTRRTIARALARLLTQRYAMGHADAVGRANLIDTMSELQHLAASL